jgi:acyl transferase domain-containing protein/acyl-CoA synthetase (AMP-forming)/AMP-acid ligase II/acyl carrier protein
MGDTSSRTITFDELDEGARRIAGALERAGARGERALLLYPQGLDYIVAFFGCLYAGVVAVPLHPPRHSGSNLRLRAVADDCAARFVLSPRATLDDGLRACHRQGEPPLIGLATDVLDGDEPRAGSDIDGSGVAFLQYTSGSTGAPKGVMVTHGSLAATLEDMDRAYRHRPDSVIVSWLPLFHDLGLIYGALQPVFSGCSAVLLPPVSFLQRPLRWLQAISDHRGTHSAAPNFAYDACVRRIAAEDKVGLDLSSWEVSLNAAEPVREDTNRRFFECFATCGLRPHVVSAGYGLAEATLKVTSVGNGRPRRTLRVDPRALSQNRVVPVPPDDQAGRELSGCGQSHIDSRIIIVDSDTRRRCAPDEIGEIWVQGRSVAAGYFRRPAETAATFGARLADGGEESFLRTGDLGFLAEDELFVTGRLADTIIVRGQNHYPQDVELTVQRCHPALAPHCGAAFGLEADGEERLVVINEISRHALRDIDAKAVFAAIRRAVAEEHDLRLEAIALIRPSSLPKTSSGKVMRRTCRTRFLAGELDLVAVWRHDRSPREVSHAVKAGAGRPDEAGIRSWLRRRVAMLAGFGEAAVDTDEPLSHYGLDSLSLVSLSGELGEWLGRSLPATLFYDRPSIDLAARFIAGRSAPDARPAAAIDEPIAVIGLACRFPGGDTPQAFWNFLCAQRDAVTGVPPDRGPLGGEDKATQKGCFLPRVDLFDAPFFGISRRDAERIDPQQRLMLEVAWEALENAAVSPASLAGSLTGVFVGISTTDYLRLQIGAFDRYTATGGASSMAANRLSYRLDLKGPSVAVDTACSSSLVAVHHAGEALRRGDCDLALAGGVNLILSPDLSQSLAKAGMLAADGRCKVFDAGADGYGRGEGCGIVVLKRLGDAIAAGDDVLAVLRGIAVNQDGRSNGLTAPNGLAQQAVIRAVLDRAGARPSQIGWVECHGTGTLLGDPVEVGALAATLLDGRDAGQPLWLTSVKANIGHLEAAAGIAGFIKAVLGLRHCVVPAQAGLNRLNRHLAIEGTPARIPLANESWPAGERFAGVSSFGFGGTNAHAILSTAPAVSATPQPPFAPPFVLCLSAHDRPALTDLARRYAGFLSGTDLPLADICFTALAARSHFPYRLAVVTDNAAEMAAALHAFAAGRPAAGLFVCGEAGSASGAALGGERVTATTEAAHAYVAGRAVDAEALYGNCRRRAFLPTYPFQRRRYWYDGSRSVGGERQPALTPEAERCFHRTEWRDAPRIEWRLPENVSDVLIFNDERGVGSALGNMLRARSRRSFLVEKGEGFSRLSPTSWSVEAARPALLTRVLADIAAEAREFTDIVFLPTSDDLALAADTTSASALLAAQTRGALCLVGVLQAVLAQQRGFLPRLRIVTRGAVRLGFESGAVNLAHAAAWGLLRTLLLEQPGLEAAAVDLGPEAAPVADEAAALLAELGTPPGEDHIAWRGQRRLIGRLRRRVPAARRSPEIAPDRCHVLTGALGEIGLRVAQWLVGRGARDLVLTARRPPDPERIAALDALRACGARVEIASLDVADEGGMAALFDGLDRAGRPLAGVMHIAGVRDDMLLSQVTEERFAAVLRPKVAGSWVLHRLTRNRELDYFVLFSSIASGFGAAGQSCYAAANAFLDALAHWRRVHALPAVSINWGPWSGGGMAEGLSAVYLRRMGIALLSPALAIEALERAMGGDDPQVMVCPFDWAAMKNNYPWVRRRGFLEEVERFDEVPSPRPVSDLQAEWDPDAILDEIKGMTPEAVIAMIDRAAESVAA